LISEKTTVKEVIETPAIIEEAKAEGVIEASEVLAEVIAKAQ
jgi:hypothetical protein